MKQELLMKRINQLKKEGKSITTIVLEIEALSASYKKEGGNK